MSFVNHVIFTANLLTNIQQFLCLFNHGMPIK